MLRTVFSDAPVSKAYTSISVILQQKLARTDDESWEEQEAAVLLLGTVAEGCITGLCPYLQKVTSDRSIGPERRDREATSQRRSHRTITTEQPQ